MTITDDDLGHLLDPAREGAPIRPSRRALLIGAVVVGVLLVVAAFAIGGGHNSDNSVTGAPSSLHASSGGTSATASTPVPAPQGGVVAGAAGSAQAAAGPGSTDQVNEAAPPSLVPGDVADKVVKTGEIDLEVDKNQVPHTIDRLMALATLNRGFVAESHTEEGVTPSGSVTLRVPVEAFDATLTSVRHLTGKVVSEQTAGEDVTAKYVDLQARIHSLSSTRAAFERLLSRATTIGDTLAVQSRITNVQTQIEQLQGQLRVLNDQATYGTLTVTVAEKGKATVVVAHHHQSGMSRAIHRSVDRFVNGIEAIVGVIGPLLLVALLGGLAWLVGRFAYRRFRRQPA